MKSKPKPVCPHLNRKQIGTRNADGSPIEWCLDCGEVLAK